MSFEWQKVEIGQLAKLRSGYPFKSADWKDSGVPVIKIANVKGGRIIPDGCGFVSTEVASKSADWYTRTGDVLIAMTGYVGEVAQVKPGQRYLINQRVGRFDFLPSAEIESTYFFYHLQHPDTRAEIEGIARGSAQPNLSASDAHKIGIALPPRAVQREIAATLGSLDDRITLLRETNATLEAIAQALFKSWFVDFDPVRAKMAGRAPEGMDDATAALFPEALEETELGVVPKGWRVGKVSDLGNVVCGKTPPTSCVENYGDDVPFITIPDMHGLLAVTETARSLSRQGADSQSKKYLPAGAVCVSCIATPGLVVQVTTPSQTNQQINSVIPFDLWGEAFPLFLLRRVGGAVRMGGSGGSVFHNLSKSGFEAISVLLPSHALAQAFNDYVEPLIKRVVENQRQVKVSSDLRDTLLPRLISGQLRLPEAQAQRDAIA